MEAKALDVKDSYGWKVVFFVCMFWFLVYVCQCLAKLIFLCFYKNINLDV